MSERIPSLFFFFRTTKQRTQKNTTPGLLQKHLYCSRWQNDPKSTPVSGDVSPAWCNGARNGIVNTFFSLSHLGLLFTPLTPLLKFRTNSAERDPVRNTYFPLLAHTATHVFNTHVLRGSVLYVRLAEAHIHCSSETATGRCESLEKWIRERKVCQRRWCGDSCS